MLSTGKNMQLLSVKQTNEAIFMQKQQMLFIYTSILYLYYQYVPRLGINHYSLYIKVALLTHNVI